MWTEFTAAVPSPQTAIANTDAACAAFCDSKAPKAYDNCLHNGTIVKAYSCEMFWPGGGSVGSIGTADNDAACISYCQEVRANNAGQPNLECRRNGVLLMANGLVDFQPPETASTTLTDDDTGDEQPDGSRPTRLWDCAGVRRTTSSTFGSCVNSTTALDTAEIKRMQLRARAYLTYITGGGAVPATDANGVDLQGPNWGNTTGSRQTARRLCWLRQAFLQGKIRGRHRWNTSICGRSAALYGMSGTLAGVDVSACGGTIGAHTNPAEQVAIINRTIRHEAGACGRNDPVPTFFHASHYRVVGDTSFVIDPEAATVNADWPSSASSAAATGVGTLTPVTAYRYGSAYPPKSGRTGWIGQPCVVSTATVTANTRLNQVWFPVPTNSNYLMCAPCGASGQACCPNADYATSLKSTTCDANDGLGCNTGTGKCY